MTDLRVPTEATLGSWRSALGRSAGLWGRRRLEVDESSWLAFSGHRHVDFNVACLHGRAGPAEVERALAAIADLGAPALVMVAGAATGLAGHLADHGMVCVTATPLVCVPLRAGTLDAAFRTVPPEGRPAARALIASAFGFEAATATVALPAVAGPAGERVYGLREGGATVSTVVVAGTGPVRSVWSMATPAALQRRGYGRRLFEATMHAEAAHGVTHLVFLASPPGLPLYLAAGGGIVEYWQVWSRPRWVLGR